MRTVRDILQELGGVSAVSTETGIPLTTVHSWARSGAVPEWRVPVLVQMGAKVGRPMLAGDVPTRRRGKQAAAA